MTFHPLPFPLERFFTDRLANQLDETTNTVDSYRRSFVLLLKFARDRLGREPTHMLVSHIDVELVGGGSTTSKPNAATLPGVATPS